MNRRVAFTDKESAMGNSSKAAREYDFSKKDEFELVTGGPFGQTLKPKSGAWELSVSSGDRMEFVDGPNFQTHLRVYGGHATFTFLTPKPLKVSFCGVNFFMLAQIDGKIVSPIPFGDIGLESHIAASNGDAFKQMQLLPANTGYGGFVIVRMVTKTDPDD